MTLSSPCCVKAQGTHVWRECHARGDPNSSRHSRRSPGYISTCILAIPAPAEARWSGRTLASQPSPAPIAERQNGCIALLNASVWGWLVLQQQRRGESIPQESAGQNLFLSPSDLTASIFASFTSLHSASTTICICIHFSVHLTSPRLSSSSHKPHACTCL